MGKAAEEATYTNISGMFVDFRRMPAESWESVHGPFRTSSSSTAKAGKEAFAAPVAYGFPKRAHQLLVDAHSSGALKAAFKELQDEAAAREAALRQKAKTSLF